MNSVGSIKLSHFIVTIISLGIFFFIGSIIQVEAVKKEGALEDYNNLKDLVGDIRNGNFSDDQISLNHFKNSVPYKDADENIQKCINLAAKIGHNLGDYEIVHCFENTNFFKDKYLNVSAPQNKVSQRESVPEKNVTQANVTQKVPEPETELKQSIPETNASLNAPETNASLNAPETNASLNAPETNASQEVSKGKMALNVTVAKDPITPGESQVVTAVASDPVTGKILDHVFIKLTIKDPIGIILKNYTATEGSVTRSFKIGYNAVGKFTILATASQAGIESRKSLPFHVQ